MLVFEWMLANHVLFVVVSLISLLLARSVLHERRPAASAFAWLLVLLLLPYVGIPLYLALGGRKIGRRAQRKQAQAEELREVNSAATRIDWLDDGVLAFDAFLQGIRTAQRSIRIVTFVLGDDEAGRALLEAMIERARAGVEVRLLLDDFLRFRAPRTLLADLVRAGGRVERFMPLVHLPFRARTNLRNHRKIAVFDGHVGILGGMNLADEYLGPKPSADRWRDLSLRLEGPVVRVLDALVRADWHFACGERLTAAEAAASAEGVAVQVVPTGPDAPTDPLYDALLTALYRAEQRIWVATPYFVPDEALMRALRAATRRGVDVRLYVPAVSNHGLADRVAAPSLRELEANGARILRYPRMLHAKTVLVDQHTAMVGSANFDMRSLFLDYEIVLTMHEAAEVRALQRWFEATERDATAGAPVSGFWQRRLEGLAWLLSPLI